jgi:hypothetical protein
MTVQGQPLTPAVPGAQPATATQGGPTPLQQNTATFNQAVASPQQAISAAFAPGVTDHLAEYVKASNGHVDPQMLKTISTITEQRRKDNTSQTNSDALKSAYSTPAPDAGSPASTGPVADAQGRMNDYISGGGSDPKILQAFSKHVDDAKAQVLKQQQADETRQIRRFPWLIAGMPALVLSVLESRGAARRT